MGPLTNDGTCPASDGAKLRPRPHLHTDSDWTSGSPDSLPVCQSPSLPVWSAQQGSLELLRVLTVLTSFTRLGRRLLSFN